MLLVFPVTLARVTWIPLIGDRSMIKLEEP
jgi:hypothetical protein